MEKLIKKGKQWFKVTEKDTLEKVKKELEQVPLEVKNKPCHKIKDKKKS